MKRLGIGASPSLDELLNFAASYDEGRFALDSYEIYELLDWLLADAHAKLGLNSELRLGGASVQKDCHGIVTAQLRQRGLCMKYCVPTGKEAA